MRQQFDLTGFVEVRYVGFDWQFAVDSKTVIRADALGWYLIRHPDCGIPYRFIYGECYIGEGWHRLTPAIVGRHFGITVEEAVYLFNLYGYRDREVETVDHVAARFADFLRGSRGVQCVIAADTAREEEPRLVITQQQLEKNSRKLQGQKLLPLRWPRVKRKDDRTSSKEL